MCFNGNGELKKLGKSYETDNFIFDTNDQPESITNVESSYEEEVLNALTLGVKDYLYKTGFKKVIVGLSGGIDSALVTYIAVNAVGKENVHVVMMPSMYSSEGSISDSKKLVENLGITSNQISIEPVFDEMIKVLSPYFNGLPVDVTEENIQARIRGIYLMAMSNKLNFLLCTTGNKSEMAVGYATLYGDMCGALAVIADVYKTEVYQIARFINRHREIIPNEIIEKAPSAELRHDQKDEDSLPPYNLLDQIIKLYLENYKEYSEIVEKVGNPEIVKKVLTLVDRNEFKRKQAAPSLRVTTKSFGYGRRFPIVQKWR